jgi:hypothetical protein
VTVCVHASRWQAFVREHGMTEGVIPKIKAHLIDKILAHKQKRAELRRTEAK